MFVDKRSSSSTFLLPSTIAAGGLTAIVEGSKKVEVLEMFVDKRSFDGSITGIGVIQTEGSWLTGNGVPNFRFCNRKQIGSKFDHLNSTPERSHYQPTLVTVHYEVGIKGIPHIPVRHRLHNHATINPFKIGAGGIQRLISSYTDG